MNVGLRGVSLVMATLTRRWPKVEVKVDTALSRGGSVPSALGGVVACSQKFCAIRQFKMCDGACPMMKD